MLKGKGEKRRMRESVRVEEGRSRKKIVIKWVTEESVQAISFSNLFSISFKHILARITLNGKDYL